MRRLFLTYLLLLFSCTKQKIITADVVSSLKMSPSTVPADGTSLISVTVFINKDADADKRKLVFETSAGMFSNNTRTITLEALLENGQLVARTTIKAPSSPGIVVVTVQPEIRSSYNDFIVKDSVTATPSLPASIKVEASTFGVRTDYLGEAQITGTLKNANNNNVSTGVKILYEDYFPGGAPVNGRFRALQVVSDENSKVSTAYSPGHLTPGQNIYVRYTVLDSAGNRTPIKDSVLLTVIP